MRSTRPSRKRGITWEALLNWAADLPGVQQGICYGTPALYVRKRILARLREDGETVAIKIDFLDRDVLLEADPVAFFLTDHDRPYPMVVMRLNKARPAVAQGLLEQAWQRAASKSLAATRAVGTGRSAGKPAQRRAQHKTTPPNKGMKVTRSPAWPVGAAALAAYPQCSTDMKGDEESS